jgi:hypothetical protein
LARPSEFSQQIADQICERLADGESLRGICAGDEMPNKSTVFRWLAARKEFSDQYARAREEQAETLADEIVEIADDDPGVISRGEGDRVEVSVDSAAVAHQRLRIDARKWVASKLKPKKYGDKVSQEISGEGGGPIVLGWMPPK